VFGDVRASTFMSDRSRQMLSSACQCRQSLGFLLRVLNAQLIGPQRPQACIAIAELKLSDTHATAPKEFQTAAVKIPEVKWCLIIAEKLDNPLKIWIFDVRKCHVLLSDRISNLFHAASTSTFVAIKTIRDMLF
jgi:hypothetical protein